MSGAFRKPCIMIIVACLFLSSTIVTIHKSSESSTILTDDHINFRSGEHGISLSLPTNQPDTVLFAPGGITNIEFFLEHTGSTTSELQVVFDLSSSLPSTWSDPIWDKPSGYLLQGSGAFARPILAIEVPDGDLSTAPDKLEVEARAFADNIDGTSTEVAMEVYVLDIIVGLLHDSPHISIYEDLEHQTQIADSSQSELYDINLQHDIDDDEVGFFYIDIFNPSLYHDNYVIKLNERPGGWQFQFLDNETGLELSNQGPFITTPVIGSRESMTINLRLYPPSEMGVGDDKGKVTIEFISIGDNNFTTQVSFTVNKDYGIFARVASDSDLGAIGYVGPINPGDHANFTLLVTETIPNQNLWQLINYSDSPESHSDWDLSFKDANDDLISQIDLITGVDYEVQIKIKLPDRIEAGTYTIKIMVSEFGVDINDATYYSLDIAIKVDEFVEPDGIQIRSGISTPFYVSPYLDNNQKNVSLSVLNNNNIPIGVRIEVECPEYWHCILNRSIVTVGAEVIPISRINAYRSESIVAELIPPQNISGDVDIEFTINSIPVGIEQTDYSPPPYSPLFETDWQFSFSTKGFDFDNDGVNDYTDAFPFNPNETHDDDGDGIGNNSDAFPHDANETLDSDNDGVGDNLDQFPLNSNETKDSDNDGIGNNADAFPEDALEWEDTDGDGVGDNSDLLPNNPDVRFIEDIALQKDDKTSSYLLTLAIIVLTLVILVVAYKSGVLKSKDKSPIDNKHETSVINDQTHQTQSSIIQVQDDEQNHRNEQWTDDDGYTWKKDGELLYWWNGDKWERFEKLL